MKTKNPDQYSPKENNIRFEAALRGARLAGPQHMQSVTPKRASKQRARKASAPKDAARAFGERAALALGRNVRRRRFAVICFDRLNDLARTAQWAKAPVAHGLTDTGGP